MAALQERIAKFAPDSGTVRIGVGESYPATPPLRRYIAILVSSSPLRLDPVAREQESGDTVRVAGYLPASYQKLRAVIQRPDGSWEDSEARRTGRDRFELRIPMGREPGIMSVELIADRETGPHPLAQLEFHVDTPLASRFEGRWPGDETHVVTAEDLSLIHI